MTDGNLRPIFRAHLPKVHWQAVETAFTGRGVPDVNGCYRGVEFWVENKLAYGQRVKVDGFQVAWHERRQRAGGRTFFAVRQTTRTTDALHIFGGWSARALLLDGLSTPSLASYVGGPSAWEWEGVLVILTSVKAPPRAS